MSTLGIVVVVLWSISAALFVYSRAQDGHGPSAGCAGILALLAAAVFLLAGMFVLAWNHGF